MRKYLGLVAVALALVTARPALAWTNGSFGFGYNVSASHGGCGSHYCSYGMNFGYGVGYGHGCGHSCGFSCPSPYDYCPPTCGYASYGYAPAPCMTGWGHGGGHHCCVPGPIPYPSMNCGLGCLGFGCPKRANFIRD